MVYVTCVRPLDGWIFCHHTLELAKINPPTKTEVSVSTHYEDVKGYTKYRKRGGFACLRSFKVIGNSTIR